MREYGKAIKTLRKRAGLTQAQLADKLNVTYQTVSKWETEVNKPDISVVESACALFGVTLDEFLRLADGESSAAEPVASAEVSENFADTASGEYAAADDAAGLEYPEAAAETYHNNTRAASGSKSIHIALKLWQIIVIAVAAAAVILTAILVPVLLSRRSDKDTPRRSALSASKIYETVDPSVFCLLVSTQNGVNGGSGFFTDDEGRAVTNYSVIKGAQAASVILHNGEIYEVDRILGVDEKANVAVIHVNIGRSVPVEFSTEALRTGDTVYAIGYPEPFEIGSQGSMQSDGKVSDPSCAVDGINYIKTTCNMKKGNRGGVLVDVYGCVVGMTSVAMYDVNMAVPSYTVMRVDENIDLSIEEYAQRYGTQYKVMYYVNGELYDTKILSAADSAENITPVSDEYEFLGWYDDVLLTREHDFSAALTADTKLYAKIRYSDRLAAFDGGAGAAGTLESIAVGGDDTVILPENVFERNGYEFDGWSYNGRNYAPGDAITVSETTKIATVKAVWKPITYTVRYTYGGKSYSETHTFDAERKLRGACFERVGYEQVGWVGKTEYELGAAVKNLASVKDAVVELAPKWKPIEYTMSIDLNAPYAYFDSVEYERGDRLWITCVYGEDPLAAHRARRYNMGFVEWQYFDADGELYTGDVRYINSDPSRVVTAKAKWVSGFYTLQLCEERLSSAVINAELEGDQSYTLPPAAELFTPRTGYRFSRWVQGYTNETVYFADGATVADLMLNGFIFGSETYVVLYAEWEPVEYTVNFVGGEGAKGEMPPVVCTYNEKIVLPENAFVKDGFGFAGWAFGDTVYANCAELKNLVSEPVDLTFTARWVKNFEGEGTVEDPFLVNDYSALAAVYDYTGYVEGGHKANFALTADIDCTGCAPLYPIGSPKSYSGVFDGRGHVIRNVAFAADTVPVMGLFGSVYGGQILRLGIENYSFDIPTDGAKVYSVVAPLVCSYVSKSPLECCYAIGGNVTVKNASMNRAGGLVGVLNGTAINCYAQVNVTVESYGTSYCDMYVGGLAAEMFGGEFNDGDFDSSINDHIHADGKAVNCYADMSLNVISTGVGNKLRIYGGLLVGKRSGSKNGCIENCFTAGEIRFNFASNDVNNSDLRAFVGKISGDDDARENTCFNNYTCAEMIFTNGTGTGVTLDDEHAATLENLSSVSWLAANLSFDTTVWKDGAALPELI